jgi:hypothetical protein
MHPNREPSPRPLSYDLTSESAKSRVGSRDLIKDGYWQSYKLRHLVLLAARQYQ